MRDRRLGLGFMVSLCGGALLPAACGSGSPAPPPPIQAAGRAGASGGAGVGGTNGSGGSQDEGGADSGGQAATGGSSQAGSSGAAGSGGFPPGAGVGDSCADGTRCRSGLECLDGACTPAGDVELGQPCVIQPECQAGLQCIARTCVPAGEGEAGETCLLDDDCEAGLRCVITGLEATCTPQGDGDLGDECTRSTDCFGGLACVSETCVPQPAGIPVWPGVECEPPREGPVRAFFEVPGAPDAEEGDFFRLPYPNDALLSDDGLDLDDFPVPGTGVLGVDPVKLYVDALKDEDGWGAYTTVYFRFSGALNVFDGNSTRLDVAWVDVTPGAPEFGSSVGLGWYYSGGGNNYLCHNWIGVRRPRGYPLLPGHTYAVWITTDLTAEDGSEVTPSPNLLSVLADQAPTDPILARVHDAYAPFRDYLAGQGLSPFSVLTAAVFTVDGVRDTMSDLADAVEPLPPPALARTWVKCEDGQDSPCPDHEGPRNCGSGAKEYDEYHAVVKLPNFQTGTLPYEQPEDGGGIEIQSDPPTEDVCLALTVPTGTMPEAGWPLVVFAHGTGGSFRSHVESAVAGELSVASVPFAVLGIDQVSNGARRGDSTAGPDELFFNFMNPAAARGNPLQGAVDQISLAKFAAVIDGSEGTPTKIDPTKLVFFGHSQGATEGSLMLPYADAYKAAVLSGNGASLMNALTTKTEPVDIAGLMPIALSDLQGLSGDIAEYHPVLSLLQHWIDPADPLNFARYAGAEPLQNHVGKHVFQSYGTNDHYSPPLTLALYAKAGVLTLLEPAEDDLEELFGIALATSSTPISGNAQGGTLTLGMRQYEAATDSDGHFVVFDVPQANEDAVNFLSQAVSGQLPVIGGE